MFYCFLFFLCWRRPLDIGPKYSNRFCWFTVLGKKSSLFSLSLLYYGKAVWSSSLFMSIPHVSIYFYFINKLKLKYDICSVIPKKSKSAITEVKLFTIFTKNNHLIKICKLFNIAMIWRSFFFYSLVKHTYHLQLKIIITDFITHTLKRRK